jgi:hypothetical protein
MRQLAAAFSVYAFFVSGFPFSNTEYQRETGSLKAAASCRTPKAPCERQNYEAIGFVWHASPGIYAGREQHQVAGRLL